MFYKFSTFLADSELALHTRVYHLERGGYQYIFVCDDGDKISKETINQSGMNNALALSELQLPPALYPVAYWSRWTA